MILFLLWACQEPFSVERHDLGPFRIAAIGVIDGEARAAVWSGEGLYHEASPHLDWSLDGAPLGEGFGVAVPAEGGRLGLVATSPDGEERRAEVTVAPAPPAFPIDRFAISPGEDLSLEARAGLDETPITGSAPADAAVRLRAGVEPGYRLRWMTAEGLGTPLELDEQTVDLLGEEVVFDDGLVASRDPLEPQVYTLLALAIDGRGANRWAWEEAAIGVETPLTRVDGWLLDLGEGVGPGLVAVTAEESDDLRGLRFTDPTPVTDLSAVAPLPCAVAGAPFDLSFLVEGRCPRPDVVGQRLILDVP